MSNKHQGSDFDSFLEKEGLLAGASATATKRVLAYQFALAMKKKRFSKVSLAAKMQTSRSALDRLLDPDNRSVTLQTIERAALVLGKKLKITLTESSPQKPTPRKLQAANTLKKLKGKVAFQDGYDYKALRGDRRT